MPRGFAAITPNTSLTWAIAATLSENRVSPPSILPLGALSVVEATQIVRFHQLADSVRADVSSGGGLAIRSVDHESWGDCGDFGNRD